MSELMFNKMGFWQKILFALFRKRIWNIGSEDTQCFVRCECVKDDNRGYDLSIGDYSITRCPGCGRGYSTQFRAFKYPRFLK